MSVGAGLYMYDVVVKKFTFAISSPDEFLSSLWPPYVGLIGQAIIFSSCGYFYPLLSFFPRLFSAAADWMSTILPHMCEFRMQVWNVLHAARWNSGGEKSPKIRHLRTIAQLCRAICSQLTYVSTIRKKIR